MGYSSGIGIKIGQRKLCRTKVLWVLNFGEVGDRTNKNQNPPMYEDFLFFIQNFIFGGLGALFGTFLVIFLNYRGRRKKKENKKTKVRIIQEIRKRRKEKMGI